MVATASLLTAFPLSTRVSTHDNSTGTVTGHDRGYVLVTTDDDGKEWSYLAEQLKPLTAGMRQRIAVVRDGAVRS